jgi:hypothetical protein
MPKHDKTLDVLMQDIYIQYIAWLIKKSIDPCSSLLNGSHCKNPRHF